MKHYYDTWSSYERKPAGELALGAKMTREERQLNAQKGLPWASFSRKFDGNSGYSLSQVTSWSKNLRKGGQCSKKKNIRGHWGETPSYFQEGGVAGKKSDSIVPATDASSHRLP